MTATPESTIRVVALIVQTQDGELHQVPVDEARFSASVDPCDLCGGHGTVQVDTPHGKDVLADW